jgi:hypothetical protein
MDLLHLVSAAIAVVELIVACIARIAFAPPDPPERCQPANGRPVHPCMQLR